MPALVAGGAATDLAIAASISERQKLIERYLKEATRAFESKDYSWSQLLSERLTQLEGQSQESLFRLAQALDAQGQTGRTQSILDGIAPLDQPGIRPRAALAGPKVAERRSRQFAGGA